jgi:CRISPR-associated endonuclease/helicase Cas3
MISDLFLSNLGLDTFSKTSHKNNELKKPLKQHIQDIYEISDSLASKHEFVEYESILKDLAWWHDLGKLNPSWNIDEAKKPPHSALSAYIFLNYSKIKDPKLFYYILKHHSNLTPFSPGVDGIRKNVLGRIKFPIEQNSALKSVYGEAKDFNTVVENDIKENVSYTDLFGIFKIGDIVSAMFESENELISEKPFPSGLKLKQSLKKHVESKGLIFDETKWNLFQSIANSGENILFSAPTGWGKTFASLKIASTKNPSHVIYVLPTVTAIRKMKKTLEKLLKTKVEESYYFADVEKVLNEKSVEWDLFVSRTFMSPIILTTLDQIVLTFLHTRKYFLKRFNLRNSVLIFDEFHLYPHNGLYILLNFIKKFNENFNYNIKTVFMSATAHPALEKLVNSYISPAQFNFIDEYKKKKRYLYSFYKEDIINHDVLVEIMKRSQNGNILVICNTVEKAIKTYLLLKNLEKEYEIKNVLLLHSRFTYKGRRKKEDQLDEFSKLNKGFIFVSTQVAEVSLDMSFDYLFTELAPISSLIQRFGRVNRYSDTTDEENVTILYPSELDTSKRYPYDLDELKSAINILEKFEENLENEFELLEQFKNNSLELDKVKLKEIDKYLEKWAYDTKYLFSVDLTDEKLDKILRFRETNTAMVIPDCFTSKVLEILDDERKYKYQRAKAYLTPIPIWWLFLEDTSILDEYQMPVFSNPRFFYSREIGYFDSERLSEFIDNIEYVKKM